MVVKRNLLQPLSKNPISLHEF